MRNQLKIVYGALTIVAMLGLTSTVQGVPAFARQTGLDCNSCHAAPGFPTLNSFGAAFKAAGYTQASEDNLIGDGEALSIPKALNMSVVYKVRQPIEVAGGKTVAPFENPDEIALLLGGRIAPNIGYVIEAGGTSLDFASLKVVFAPEIGPVRLGIVPWFSDLGPGYIFETLSTGAVRNIRSMENRKVSSAINAIEYGGANATAQSGLGLYVWNPMFFVTLTPFMATAFDPQPDWTVNSIGYYGRVAVTPTLGPVDLGVGVQYYFGKADDLAGGVAKLNTLGVDVQAMMNVGIPLSVFLTYANDIEGQKSAANISVDAAIIPDVLMLDLAFRLGLTTNVDNEIGIGAKFHIVRNVKLEVDVAYSLPATGTGELQILPLIFGAF
jgi:hypothetical protein